MSKENGFYCDNPEHGHITSEEAVECYGKAKLTELWPYADHHLGCTLLDCNCGFDEIAKRMWDMIEKQGTGISGGNTTKGDGNVQRSTSVD